MTIKEIRKLQEAYSTDRLQKRIEDGSIWKLEGYYGRLAMGSLECGACFLPNKQTSDYYGNTIPSRKELEPGTKGTVENANKFWTDVQDGEISMEDLTYFAIDF